MPPPPVAPLNNQVALNAAQAGAAAIQDPNNPLGASQNAVLQPIHDITYGNLQTGATANAAVNQAQIQVAAEKAAAAAKTDPSKYQKIQTQDGGYKFYGPDGKEVSAIDYARVNNTTPDKVLADSQNPIDIAFQQDYQQLQNYFSAKLNSKTDPDAAATAATIEKKVKDDYGIDLSKQNHQQVVQSFMQAYPTVFGLHTTGVQGTNALLPNQNYLDTQAQGAGGSSIGG